LSVSPAADLVELSVDALGVERGDLAVRLLCLLFVSNLRGGLAIS
jgi:hypothetical protein